MTQTNSLSRTSPAVQASSAHLVQDAVVKWLRAEAGSSVDRVDLDASLVALGVDSLGAASIGYELEVVTQKKFHPEIMFELETIREISEFLDSLPAQSDAPIPSLHALSQQESETTSTPRELGTSSLYDPIEHYERLNRRVRLLKQEEMYFFETEISAHDGAWVVAHGQRMLMLSSYEYLGLLGHPHLKAAALAGLEQYGTGHHGARLLVGTTTVHKQLEAQLAEFMNAQDALVFNSGYVANLATISALVGPGDCILGDQFNHASIVDGCRMSGAELMEFRHNDPDALAELLRRTNGRRTLVIVDAVFSMEGDIINLPPVVSLCKEHRALLMVDEAHSVGVLGAHGRGIQEHFHLEPDAIDIKMGTLSKALAGSGGFVAGREELITYLRHHARGYIFSGALPAAQASVSVAALEILERTPEIVSQLWRNVDQYVSGLKKLGFDTAACQTPVVPIMTKNDQLALEMTQMCRSLGLLVVPVCYPAVPMDAPRLRTCVSAVHTPDDIDFALEVLKKAGRQTKLIA